MTPEPGFADWAHAVLLTLKELEDKTYRFVVDMVAEMPLILALLRIEQAPHWTTLHRAAQRFRGSVIARLIAYVLCSAQKASAYVRA